MNPRTNGRVPHGITKRENLIPRILGITNLALATLGLVQLMVNTVSARILGDRFMNEYAGVVNYRREFEVMSVATVVLLVPLGLLGFLHVRGHRRAAVASKIFFFVETASFVLILWIWRMPLFPVSPLSVAMMLIIGVINAGIALQIVTAYPLIGFILLMRGPRRQQMEAGRPGPGGSDNSPKSAQN